MVWKIGLGMVWKMGVGVLWKTGVGVVWNMGLWVLWKMGVGISILFAISIVHQAFFVKWVCSLNTYLNTPLNHPSSSPHPQSTRRILSSSSAYRTAPSTILASAASFNTMNPTEPLYIVAAHQQQLSPFPQQLQDHTCQHLCSCFEQQLTDNV